MREYSLPTFLAERCTQQAYEKWLGRKAIAHVRRDRKRGHKTASREDYMIAIHKAVIEAMDAITIPANRWRGRLLAPTITRNRKKADVYTRNRFGISQRLIILGKT